MYPLLIRRLVKINLAHQGVSVCRSFKRSVGVRLPQTDPQKPKCALPCVLRGNKTHINRVVCCLSLIIYLFAFDLAAEQTVSVSYMFLVVLVHLSENGIFRSTFAPWFTLQQQLTDAFMIRVTKLEPEKSKAAERQERKWSSGQARIISACYLFWYWSTQPINLCFQKMNVVIVIVKLIAVYCSHGTGKHSSPW